MRTLLAILSTITALTFAQQSSPVPPNAAQPVMGSITGFVREQATGAPMANVHIYIDRGTPNEAHGSTDSEGRYTIFTPQDGTHRVQAYADQSNAPAPSDLKIVTVKAGQRVTPCNFELRSYGTISGTIFDENAKPVPGLTVFLVAREYQNGSLRHFFAGLAPTDAKGSYVLANVEPGRGYLLLAKVWRRKVEAESDAPLKMEDRKQIVVPTYYPSVPYIAGAQALVLTAGEHRENVDLKVSHSPSYCVEGILEADGQPASLQFQIAEDEVESGVYSGGDQAVSIRQMGGMSGADGKIRVCDLHPGEYTLMAASVTDPKTAPTFFGSTSLAVTDGDIQRLVVGARPRLVLKGEVSWSGSPPDNTAPPQLRVWLQPANRSLWPGESLGTRCAVPCQFAMSGVFADDYNVNVSGVPKDLYVSDILYSSASARHAPLRVGAAVGDQPLRITLGLDGGFVDVAVQDSDGNPVPGLFVCLMPANSGSDALLAATIVSERTDQEGAFHSKALAPGKYYALLSSARFNSSPETVARLLAFRTRAQAVDVTPNAHTAVTLKAEDAVR